MAVIYIIFPTHVEIYCQNLVINNKTVTYREKRFIDVSNQLI